MLQRYVQIYEDILVGGLEHFLFFHILGIIIPTDFHIFQRGRVDTTNQYTSVFRSCPNSISNDLSRP